MPSNQVTPQLREQAVALRDMPRPGRLSYEEFRQRNREGVAKFWTEENKRREAGRQAVSRRAAAEIGTLSDREILIAGAIAYWCEGSKSKHHNPKTVRKNTGEEYHGCLAIRVRQSAGLYRRIEGWVSAATQEIIRPS
jgi:hypothetical protein